jgi:macrolide transport system ATP-binding/permease protein
MVPAEQATMMDRLARDFRYAARALWRSPVFAVTSTVMLALGIGVDLALFQIVNVALFEPLPVKAPTTLVRLHRHSPKLQSNALPYPAAEVIRLHSPVFSAVLLRSLSEVTWQDDGMNRVRAAFVSTNWFVELGYEAALGRVFGESDGRPETEPVVVVSSRLWRQRLGSAPDAIGQTIRLNGQTTTIIGVAPAHFPGFRFEHTDVWVPVNHLQYFNPGSRAATADWDTDVQVYGRLRDGVSIHTARDQLRATSVALAGQQPERFQADGWLELYSAADHFRGARERREAVTVAAMFGGLALLILVIASFNLTGLLLSRLTARAREISIRSVVGAGPWWTVQPIVLEVVLISVVGGVGGLIIARGTLHIVQLMADLPEYVSLAPNSGTILAALGAMLLAALIVGLVPGYKLARRSPGLGLKDGDHSASQGLSASRFRRQLVAVQVAGSCLLLVCSSQMVISVQSALSARQRFLFDRMALFEPKLAEHGLTGSAAEAYWDELKRSLRTHPDVQGLALASHFPFRTSVPTSKNADLTEDSIASIAVEAEFFSMLAIPLIGGRHFSPSDDPAATVIINRTLAESMYGTVDAVGRPYPGIEPKSTIVGVVEHGKLRGDRGSSLEEYVPVRSRDARVLVVKAGGDPARLMAAFSASARALDPDIHERPRLMRDELQDEFRAPLVASRIASVIAALGLSLSSVGLFGLISYNTRLRLREIGIRLALGARSSSIVMLTVREVAWIGGGGLVSGLVLGRVVTEVFRVRDLYLQTPEWPAYLAAVTVFMFAAVTAATWPVLSALRGQAIDALRAE